MVLLRILLDTFVLSAILWFTLRGKAPKWTSLAGICLALAVWKRLLYTWMGVPAIVPVLITVGLVVRLGFAISTRTTLYILGAYVVVRILLGSILEMALGVLDLFFA